MTSLMKYLLYCARAEGKLKFGYLHLNTLLTHHLWVIWLYMAYTKQACMEVPTEDDDGGVCKRRLRSSHNGIKKSMVLQEWFSALKSICCCVSHLILYPFETPFMLLPLYEVMYLYILQLLLYHIEIPIALHLLSGT